MRKRKITRKTLDELAKVMPVLTEQEMKKCIGGKFYFDEWGHFIEERHAGNEIVIINRSQFDDGEYSKGISFDSAIKGVKTNVIEYVKTRIGYSGNVSLQPSSGTLGGVDEKTGEIYLSQEKTHLFNDFYSLMSTLEHEIYHKNEGHYDSGKVTPAQEGSTYYYQVCSPTFRNAPLSYRKETARFWLDACYVKTDGTIPENAKKSVYSQCGLDETGTHSIW